MKKAAFIGLALIAQISMAQRIENGDFEKNSAHGDQINLSNESLNNMLPDVTAFGSYGDVDIISSNAYGGGGAQHGRWYIALTGGGTDIVALKLSEPLQRKKVYKLTFFDRKDRTYNCPQITIGLSNYNNTFGRTVYTAPTEAVLNTWSKREFTFTTSGGEQYITVQMVSGALQDWVNVDHFTLGDPVDEITGVLEKDSVNNVVNMNHTLKKDSLWESGDSIDIGPPQFVKEKKFVKFNRRRANGRRYEVQQRMEVSEPEICLLLWDKNRVDGDLVSVYRDGEVLEENVEISKEKKEIRIKLEPGKNIITIFAINLGKIPPNTVAVALKQKRFRPITLTSNLNKSGSMEINYTGETVAMK